MDRDPPPSALGWAGLLAAILATPAFADPTRGPTSSGSAPIYDVTDLGTDFHFIADSAGNTTAVTTGDGTQSYAFNKFPVNYDTKLIGVDDPLDPRPYYHYSVASNRYGAIGYDRHLQIYSDGYTPQNTYGGYLWYSDETPANDFNIHGQVVGSSLGRAVTTGDNGTALPFSYFGYDKDALDYMVPASLGLHLTAALYVDDLGRIIAEDGSTGEDYLLTPTDLPAPAPEPSTLATLGVVLAGLGVRARNRRQAITTR